MNEENNNNQEELNEEKKDNTKEIAEGAKEGANLAKNVATGNALGAAKNTLKLAKNKQVRKMILAGLIPIIAIFVIIFFLATSFLGILGSVADTVKELLNGAVDAVVNFFTVNDGKIEITTDQIDTIINAIETSGISTEDLKLLGEYEENATDEEKQEALRKYIREFYEAQAITETINYYNKPSTNDTTYGSIYVYRAYSTRDGEDGELERYALTYIPYKDMLEMQEKGISGAGDENRNIRQKFSIDESGNLVIASINRTTVEEGEGEGESEEDINLKKNDDESSETIVLNYIDYKSAVSKYTTKMNFLINLTLISQNPEFVSAVVDLIKDTRIEVTIMDNTTTTVTTETDSYTLNTREEKMAITQTGSGLGLKPKYEDDEEDRVEVTKTTVVTTEPSFKITYVKTWFGEQTMSYRSKTTGPTQTSYSESGPSHEAEPGKEEEGEWKTDQIYTEVEEVTTVQYEPIPTANNEDFTLNLGQSGDGARYANGEIEEPTFVGLMETEFRIPYSTREEAAGSNLISGAQMLFYLLQKDSELENMEMLMRYAFNIYLGRDEFEVDLAESIFNIGDFASVGGGLWSAVWDNSITREEFIQMVEEYTPPKATGNSGRSFRECYNNYFVANARNFYDICTSNNIDPRFIFCIGIHESAYGTSDIANSKGNFFGWGAYDNSPGESAWTFYDMSEGIETVSSGLNAYITPGTWQYERIQSNGYNPTTIDGIGSLYASDPNWATAIKSYMTEIFGCTGIGTGNGNIVEAAVNVHSYVRNNGYRYSQVGVTVPNVSGRTIDCSSYVTWVLVQAGVPGFNEGMYQYTSATFVQNSHGWQTISANEATAGDIVVYSGHVEIIAENSSSNNKFRVYNCGGNESIRAEGTTDFPESSISAYNKNEAIVILRIPTN